MTAKITVGAQRVDALTIREEETKDKLMNRPLAPHTSLSRQVHEAGDLLMTNAARSSDIHVSVQPSVHKSD